MLIFSTVTFGQSLRGLITGKYFLIQILVNWPEKALFSRKKKIQVHPTISLSNIQIEKVSYQKHLGILVDEKLNFQQHIDSSISK